MYAQNQRSQNLMAGYPSRSSAGPSAAFTNFPGSQRNAAARASGSQHQRSSAGANSSGQRSGAGG
jgi:hypothetical protein